MQMKRIVAQSHQLVKVSDVSLTKEARAIPRRSSRQHYINRSTS